MTDGAYALGVDFGTESGRAVLLELGSGQELAVSEVRYPHGVLDRELPDSGEQLPPDWALQHSDDWLAVLDTAIPAVLEQVPAAREAVVGLGVDFTSCTVLPVTADGQPLFKQQRWSEPPPRVAEAVEAPRGPAGRGPPQRGRGGARRELPRALRRAHLLGVVLPEADRAVARGP